MRFMNNEETKSLDFHVFLKIEEEMIDNEALNAFIARKLDLKKKTV